MGCSVLAAWKSLEDEEPQVIDFSRAPTTTVCNEFCDQMRVQALFNIVLKGKVILLRVLRGHTKDGWGFCDLRDDDMPV